MLTTRGCSHPLTFVQPIFEVPVQERPHGEREVDRIGPCKTGHEPWVQFTLALSWATLSGLNLNGVGSNAFSLAAHGGSGRQRDHFPALAIHSRIPLAKRGSRCFQTHYRACAVRQELHSAEPEIACPPI